MDSTKLAMITSNHQMQAACWYVSPSPVQSVRHAARHMGHLGSNSQMPSVTAPAEFSQERLDTFGDR